jgi:hypothetical protein
MRQLCKDEHMKKKSTKSTMSIFKVKRQRHKKRNLSTMYTGRQ